MSNGGGMLLTLKQHAESGKPIDDDLFKALTLSALHDQGVGQKKFETKMEDRIDCLEDKIDEGKGISCSQSETNKDEIDRLRDKSNRTDGFIGVMTIIGSTLGVIFGKSQ